MIFSLLFLPATPSSLSRIPCGAFWSDTAPFKGPRLLGGHEQLILTLILCSLVFIVPKNWGARSPCGPTLRTTLISSYRHSYALPISWGSQEFSSNASLHDIFLDIKWFLISQQHVAKRLAKRKASPKYSHLSQGTSDLWQNGSQLLKVKIVFL